MFILLYTNKEVKALSWTIAEFNNLVSTGDIRHPEAYKLVLRVFNLFNLTIAK